MVHPLLMVGDPLLNNPIVNISRSLKGHSSVITIINTSTEEQVVPLLEILDDVKQLTVLVSGINSIHEQG